MKLRRLLLIGAGTSGALFLFVVLTLGFIPDRELQALATRALVREGYTLRAARFGKTFPLGVKAVNLEIANDRGVILTARDAVLRLSLLSLLTGKLAFTGQAGIGSGHVTADWTPQDGAAAIEVTGVHLEDLPFIQTLTGVRAKGVARLHGRFRAKGKAGGGELQLEIKGANVADVKIGGVPLPDADYSTVQGMVRAKGGIIALESFTLQGEGLYVRLKGDLPLTTPPGAAPLNITLEMMPKPEFLEKQKFVFLLLTKYLTTPGRYEIPIRGTLANPLIQ
jgi:type II secretion system protein N